MKQPRVLEELNAVSNDGQPAIGQCCPYVVEVGVEGVAPLLFHRWSVDGIEAKAKAAKGSAAKKVDDVESYVYRDDRGQLCIPSEYFRQSVIGAARYRQDPRSPRKSAMELFKAGISCLDELCTLGTKDWDYLDRRRVTVQRNGVTRSRPAMRVGWKIHVLLQVNTPEYLEARTLNEVLGSAGRLIGVGDFRPTFGRFVITDFSVA